MPDWAGAARLADTPDRRSAWAPAPGPNLRERRVRTWPEPRAPRLNDTPRGGRPRQSSGSGRIASAAVKASPSQAHRRTAAALRRFSGQRALAGASPALAPEMPSCSNSPQFHPARAIGLWQLTPQMPCPNHAPQPVAQSPCPPCLPTIGVECGRCPTEPVVSTVQGSLSPRTTIGQLATRLLVVDTTARNILRNLTLDRSGSGLIEVHVGRSDIGSREGRGLGMPHPLKWKPTQREGER